MKIKNENKGIYIFSMPITFTCAVLVWCLTVASFAIAQLITIEWKTNDRNKSLWVFQRQFDLLIKNKNKKLTTGSRSHKHQKKKKSSKLWQRWLQNSESEAYCQCDSVGGSKVRATGILHCDCWRLVCFCLFTASLSHTDTDIRTQTHTHTDTDTHTHAQRERERERERERHTHTHTHAHTN